MRTIKRYPNRKLYDTELKEYITLNGLAELIRSGVEIQVTDHASGNDLTAVTLSQIIFEQEKSRSGFLPRSLLASLIQTSGERLNALQRSLLSPRNFLQHVDEEIRLRINELVGQGELPEAEGVNLIEKLIRRSSVSIKPGADVDEGQLERILAESNLPSRQEFERIVDQLDMLSAKLDELAQEQP